MFDVKMIRKDFLALHQHVHGKPLVYLDNAATAQKPQAVIDAMMAYYTQYCANVHRGAYRLCEVATDLYENTRHQIKRFLNAASSDEIVFTHGLTSAINLVAHSYGKMVLRPGDEVVITALEHHSNLVPWQMVCEQTGAVLKVAPILENGELDLEAYYALLGPKTRIAAFTHASNAIGTVTPIGLMIAAAHDVGAITVIDGAQSAPHIAIDVQALDADFYAFAGHKVFGPTGVGVLYGKKALLEAMPPLEGGGDMIHTVTFEHTTYAKPPLKFEAGTTNIAGVIGLGAAVDYLMKQPLEALYQHEEALLRYAQSKLEAHPHVRIVGTAPHKVPVVSFTIKGVHPHDTASILDRTGVAVRAGHMCAQPLMKRFGVPALTRASFAFYNTFEEVDALLMGVEQVCEVMRVR